MAIGDIYVTGMKSEHLAEYRWEAYADGTTTPTPAEDEMKIIMKMGEALPVIRSSGKNSLWKVIAYIC